MKTCSKCKEEKPLNAFAKRGKIRQAYCKDCQSAYRKEHYVKNRQKYIDKAEKQRNKVKKEFFEWLQTKSCIDCGESDIRTLEFDHVRGKKEGNISRMLAVASKERLLKELEKCDIVCANCHRKRTANTQNWYQYASVV